MRRTKIVATDLLDVEGSVGAVFVVLRTQAVGEAAFALVEAGFRAARGLRRA
jgi:hypothetical protein